MPGPSVSILIPCYNSAPYVEAALDSVLAQTFKDLEVIVVDDGSTDGSADIIETFASRGVKLIRQENAGAAAARNRAFAASSGSAVIYFDADDVMGDRHISSLQAAISDAPRCVAMSCWDRFYTLPSEAAFPSRDSYRNSAGAVWLTQQWMNADVMMQPGMFLLPRDLHRNVGGWDERLSLSDDFEFFARTLSRADEVRIALNARLYYRSGISGSLSGQTKRDAVESAFLSLVLGTQHLLDVDDSPNARLACANLLQNFDYTYYPAHSDLRAKARARIRELGGSNLEPSGPPRFHQLRKLVGWRAARHTQRLAERLKLNAASRRASNAISSAATTLL